MHLLDLSVVGVNRDPSELAEVPDEPGSHSLKVTCPHCHSDWHVVWDDDPGAVLPLGFS